MERSEEEEDLRGREGEEGWRKSRDREVRVEQSKVLSATRRVGEGQGGARKGMGGVEGQG